MKLSGNILYYSVNTELAYFINENFYDKHFVWCSPVYDSKKVDSLNIYHKIPPSSNPQTIYSRFKQDVAGGDLHSNNIEQNKAGLKRGAIEMLKQGVIDNCDFARVNSMIDNATIDVFSPLIYLIPKSIIEPRIKIVDVNIAANPLSVEYQICDLKKGEFEVMY